MPASRHVWYDINMSAKNHRKASAKEVSELEVNVESLSKRGLQHGVSMMKENANIPKQEKPLSTFPLTSSLRQSTILSQAGRRKAKISPNSHHYSQISRLVRFILNGTYFLLSK